MHSLNCILELLSCAVRKWMFVCTVVGQCAAVKAARSVSAELLQHHCPQCVHSPQVLLQGSADAPSQAPDSLQRV